MNQMLSVLYGVSGIAATALYLPQILRYHREPLSRLSISLFSWIGWIIISLITILYAAFVIKSILFAFVAGINTLAQLVVVGYGMQARFFSAAGMPATQALPAKMGGNMLMNEEHAS